MEKAKTNPRAYISAVLQDKQDPDRKYDVTPITIIGASDDAHIHVGWQKVSPTHAKIVLGKEGYYLEDMSKAGTLVNGKLKKKARCQLDDGDVIEIRGINPQTKQDDVAFQVELNIIIEDAEEKRGFLSRLFGRK